MREGWTYKKLGEVCNIRTGKLNANAMVEDGEYPFFTCDSNPYRIDKYAFDTEAILISGNGSLVGHVNYYKGKFNAYQRTYVLDNFSHFHIPYLLTFLKGYLRPYIKRNFKGGCIPYITLPILQSFSIPLPPKSQQEAIVSELDEINSLFALKREQLQKYDKLAQSLFYEMFGDPVENEKGWEVKKLGEICHKITDGSHFSPSGHPDGIYPMLSVKDMKGHSFSYEDCKYINEEDYAILLKQGCKPLLNDVLVAKDGSYFKTAFVIKDEREQAILSSIAILRPDLKIVEPIYLQEMLLQKSIKDSVDRFYVTGTAIKRVILKKLGTLITILPPLSLQQQFASRIEQIESQKQQVQAAIEKLETLLASRMQYWFE